MTQIEFEQHIDLINDLKKQALKLRDELSIKAKMLPESVNDLINTLTSRDNNFSSYLDFIKEFSFSDNLTAPSDLFPGIRTAADMADPEELQQKAETMKNAAHQIENFQKKGEAHKNDAIATTKRILALMVEYLQQEDQIYELELELLGELDSPYDIGQLATNS